MTIPRRIEPEWLDQLPADDPRAIRSRRDLKRINGWMRESAIMAQLLGEYHSHGAPRRIVELGAGDGTFMLSVARRMAPLWRDVSVAFVDRATIVSRETENAFHALGWRTETITADIFDFLEHAPVEGADIVTANLFLHHFSSGELARMLRCASSVAPLFLACEPRRDMIALTGSRLLFAIGCNDVSRHDAVVSVHAGFRDKELSELWPKDGPWRLHEFAALPFTHCFVASRPA
jgi:hypothetical protein